ncbi:LysR family transcriptional regulator [Neptuniibacter pectenicola]|jgi:LysR family transcriptional regulator for metE and metH|uniref:HTH-type transcriptional regulator MetR n=1 Tax=Neptuniibacter pectenicola TaxID=1806669 RepID=A0ABU9TRP2_9GAMM|nr:MULTISPECIES: LysR family transcriptional regulator [Neptuniibacter]KXJ53687.1 MAG: XRE family transcriptional regulator [Neptuniibacter sp. Phe_28]MDO6514250.1 LysR family transcriptional regulator [Neptuniibacter sp. 2_MG-2023]MDO6592621.1 LysR family transcriptional regulator [Neptuniibacter sp. 1_MG-2023]|tara:strand:+ start:7297 stop:8211 length:915 start_codon:yes stop_codon:yes gene_type:complete
MVELRHLKTLSALRDAGSLVEAAERVHLTQSALSHQIKDLEDRLNCSLFIRKTKPICFTSAGQRLLTLADEILPMIRNTERDIARLAGGEAGRLNLCIECHSCFDWLMPTIDHFRQHWPEIELDLSSGFSFQPLPALARGDLDLVITSDPEPRNGITYIPLFTYESRLAISKQHRLMARRFIHPEDLAQETLITYPVEHQRLDIFNHFLDEAGVEPQTIRTAELTIMMLQLVASGRGVAALPNWALHEYIQREYIASKPLGEKGIWCTLYAAIRDDQKDAEFMVDFLNTAKDISFRNLTGIKTA